MKFPNKYTIGWIGLFIGIILIYILWLQTTRNDYREGFFNTATAIPDSKKLYTTLNVDYPIREVFLVGDDSSSPNYANGVVASAAQGVCESYGATLATLDQLKLVFRAFPQWCTGGWVSGNTINLFYPVSGGGLGVICKNTSHSCITDDTTYRDITNTTRCIKQMPPESEKGFSLCYGVKPPQGTPNIVSFTPISYSILNTDLISSVQSDPNDIFPVTFTPQQAYYALEQSNFVAIDARKYLKDNFTSVNNLITQKGGIATEFGDNTDPTDPTSMSGWENSVDKSCDILKKIQEEFKTKLEELRTIFQRVKGRTDAAFWTKQESINLQQKVAYLCATSGYSSTTSPACKKLVSIDYNLFYKDTSVLGALESLNNTLASLQCEFQTTFKHLQVIMDILKCKSSGDNQLFDATTLGNYQMPDGSYYKCDDKIPTGTIDPRFNVDDSIGYNTQASLLLALEEISPLFNVSGYSDMFKDILNSLSFVLRLPTLNDYSTSKQNFVQINSLIASIQNNALTVFT